MHRRGYLFQQLIGLSCVVAVPLLGLLAYNIQGQAAQARESAYRSVSNYAASIGQDTDFLLTEVEQYLTFLSTRPKILALDSRQCDPILDGVLDRRRHFANVLVNDLQGRPVCLALRSPGRVPATFADAPWFRAASQVDGMAISKPYLAPIAERMVVAVSMPLRNAPGQPRTGTLTVLLDLDSLHALWSRYALPPGSRLSILNAEGTVLVTWPDFRRFVGSDASTVLRAALQSNPGGVGVAPGIDGVERVFARAALSKGGWQATAAIPTDAVFAESRAQIWRSLLAALSIALGVLGWAVLTSGRLAGYLASIAQAARAAALGDAGARASEALPGEFKDLAREFNAMQEARQRADSLLRESERRYVDLLDNVEMIALMLDRTGHVTYCNEHLLGLLGCTRAEALGLHWVTWFIPLEGEDDAAQRTAFDLSALGELVHRHVTTSLLSRGGRRRTVRWHNSVLRSTTGEWVGTASLGEDITEAIDAAHREARQRDFYAALSRTNGAIIRMTTPSALYQEICDICVQHGHASIAYISLVDGDHVRPTAWSGPAEAFLAGFEVTLDGSVPAGWGPTAMAVRTAKRYVVNDYEADPRTLPWREKAALIGTKATAAIPFQRAGQVVGTLSLHMTVAEFFDDTLIELIDEMALDISYALDNFDRDGAMAAAKREAELHSQRFRTLFQVAPVSISISSVASQRLLDVNEARCALSGQSRAELIGQNRIEAAPWADESHRQEFLHRMAQDGRVRNFEVRATNNAGEARDYLLQSDIVDFDDQACVLTITNDITDLRSAQRKLVEREQQLAGLVDTAMDAFISIDATQRIKLFNQAAADMFGVPAERALGMTVEQFIPLPLRATHHAHVAQFARTGSTARRMGALHALVGLRANGEEFPIEASISKLGEGSAALMTVVIRDASELRQAERARLAQAAAESANRAKTDFLSHMSHELRTPLNAVLGFSQLLQGHPTEPLTPNQAQQVEQIRKAGWHLLALINDVLDVTKIEAGQVEVEERSIDVQDVLEDTYRLTHGMAEAQQVRMLADYRTQASARVRADSLRLRQVLINVVTNAIKYNQAGGTVRIDLAREAEHVHIDITDTGLGMSTEQMAHLFEPFNRLGRDRGTIEGTGLGLLLTRQLVALMNGRIAIDSTPGHGTHVRVTLPADVDTAIGDTGGPTCVVERVGNGDAKPAGVVLYIEDNLVNLMIVEQLLSRWPDVALVKAETGAEGLMLARSVRPDVVLLDMRLPDMDGFAVLDALRSEEATRHLCVVALSASAMPEEVGSARTAGVREYWTKPIDFAQFLAGMTRLLDREQRHRTKPPA